MSNYHRYSNNVINRDNPQLRLLIFIDIKMDKLIINKMLCINEEWKYISELYPNVYDYYMISNYGRVKNCETNKLLQPTLRNKYYRVNLYGPSKYHITCNIHRLVAMSFVSGNTIEKCYVNHIDDDKLNNYYENLEWCTPKENIDHAYRTGLMDCRIGSNHHFNIYDENTIHKICELIELGYKPKDIIREVFGMKISKTEKSRYQRLIKHIKRKEQWGQYRLTIQILKRSTIKFNDYPLWEYTQVSGNGKP